eukprot:jgi/Botrbrau1/7000/Bobra.0165s0030.1
MMMLMTSTITSYQYCICVLKMNSFLLRMLHSSITLASDVTSSSLQEWSKKDQPNVQGPNPQCFKL